MLSFSWFLSLVKQAALLVCCAVGLFVAVLSSSAIGQQADLDRKSVDARFALKVLPIFKSKCFYCHGDRPDDIKGDLDMTSLKGLLSGGESGEPAMVVGEAEESLVVQAIEWSDLEMPPKENDRLSAEQIEQVRKWITEGAHWPSVEIQKQILAAAELQTDGKNGVSVTTVGGLADEWTDRKYKPDDIWAIRPVVRPELPESPELQQGESFRSPIDAFINRRIDAAELAPAARADARTLIRRASYDLIGLPPTPTEVDEFETAFQADANSAWRELVDRLLASPHYGERWGQHWLDVVRYADTSGFSNDFERSNAWRYRDYVIRAFNQDLPYDQFVIQQIAGDELVQEQNKPSSEQPLDAATAQIATSLLRMGPWEHTAMSATKDSRQNFLDDVTNGVGQAFLSTPLRCCKCHDHKFDPIPTADYYRVYAAFATTQVAEMEADFLPHENRDLFEQQKQHVETLLAEARKHKKRLNEKRELAARKWYAERERDDEYLEFEQRKNLEGKDKPPRFIGLSTADEGELKVREQDEWIWNRRLERFRPMTQSVYNGGEWVQESLKMRPPNPKNAQQMANDKILPETYILTGGSVHSQGKRVTPGVMSCLGLQTTAATQEDPYALPTDFGGRRLGLARWIARADNPLTTRSIVNRVWHYHFGRGIAGNPNNFGATGKKPTHPELLDWMTAEFLENGWSIKSLHRQIMNSDAYMRSTEPVDANQLANLDPDNRWMSVFEPRRLTAEEIRDSMLFATGELNPELGGLPVRPEINQEVAFSPRMLQFSLAPAYQPERTPDQRNRRSIYAYRIRGLADPLLEVLDKPVASESCELRDTASTTPQVFALLNSDVVTRRSIAMAERLQREASSVEAQVELGFQIILGQSPSTELKQELVAHHAAMLVYHADHPPQPPVYPVKLTRSLVEEFSGDPFEYQERLDIFEEYVPDRQASDVEPETRALADICLLLFNSNQFMYVY